MRWLKDVNDDIYDPTYTDMLRVAFTSEFGRGKLQDLVASLSGRNFEIKQFEDAIAEESFGKLKKGIAAFGGIDHVAEMQANLHTSCVADTMLRGEVLAYEDFLERRRRLMALKIKTWFEGL